MTYYKKILPFLIVNILGIGVLVWALSLSTSEQAEIISRDQRQGFVFTSPILDCESVGQSNPTAILYKNVKETVETLSRKYDIKRASVYYRDLNNGQWVGVNEREFFSPASLMKTPLLIAFFKNAERNPNLLGQEVVAEQTYFDYAIKQNFDLVTKIEKNKSYTLEQIAKIMIQDSDNVAALMLSKFIKEKDYNDIFAAVGVDIKEEGIDTDIRVKDFASFFRILYNASYLNRETSEKALSILAGSTFDQGLISGLPKKTTVAHKYGERALEKSDSGEILQKQLHDCGIVYLRKNPYILCVMTQGNDFREQAGFISGISEFFYEHTKGDF